MVFKVRDRFDFALPVIRANSSSESGACSMITHSCVRLPADSTLAKDSVEVNQIFGSAGATRHVQGAGLHILVAGDSDFQRRHGITPLSRNTASATAQKSASKLAASR